MNELRRALYLIRGGQGKAVRLAARRRLHWNRESIGFRRALDSPLRMPPPAVSVNVRPMETEDVAFFTDLSQATDADDALERAGALSLLGSGLRTCYVAALDDGRPCYRQFLVFPDENARLLGVFGGLIPPLAPDEALIEAAYTLPEYRARGIMPHVMSVLADVAAEAGARSLVTYVHGENDLFVRFYRRFGFEPFVVRQDAIRLLRRRVTFTPLDEDGATA